MKNFVCKRCGVEFTADTKYRKLCESCAKVSKRESTRKSQAKNLQFNLYIDTEEMLKFCLQCNKPGCMGVCDELAALARKGG